MLKPGYKQWPGLRVCHLELAGKSRVLPGSDRSMEWLTVGKVWQEN